jgi:hypothetical protein
MLVYFMSIWSILRASGIFCGHVVYCTYGYLIYVFCSHLVYCMVFWYIFPVLVCCAKKDLATLEKRRAAIKMNACGVGN